ncbi:MAG: LptF/LptG family permease [Termitinemataceae bacterium]|nr:MAG: LptF/LptG family permease [Termitinemataceae bacterium]
MEVLDLRASNKNLKMKRETTITINSPGIKHGLVSKTIFRYFFGETMFAFFVSFLFFFFIFFVNQLLLMAQQILSKKVPIDLVALLVLYSLPSIVAMSTPFATLLGTLMTIGRMTSDNEILVMLSSGLSYKNIFAPTLLVGFIVSLASFATNDILLPAGTIQFSKLYRRILVATPALELESNSVKRFDQTFVITGVVRGNTIEDLLIMDKTSEGERRIIVAKESEFVDAGRDGLRLDLSDAFVHSSKEIARRDYDYAQTKFLRYRLKQGDIISNQTTVGPREMSSVDVRKGIIEKETTLQTSLMDRNSRALEVVFNSEKILREGPSGSSWSSRRNAFANLAREIEISTTLKKDRNLSIFRLEFYKKFSIPFGSLTFIFLAVPLGLFAKKSGQTMGFIFGLIISVFYWALLLGGQNMGIRLGYSPFWTMWIPNILSFGIGGIMCIFRVRH